jgi:hypothetical protein
MSDRELAAIARLVAIDGYDRDPQWVVEQIRLILPRRRRRELARRSSR